MNEGFKLAIELVPSSLWWMNPRKSMKQSQWDKLRKQVYQQYNNTCGICGATDVRLNCHERWEYSIVDGVGTQKLIGFIALRPVSPCQAYRVCRDTCPERTA